MMVLNLSHLTIYLKKRNTCPYTSEQNGLVERKHRYIVESGLTLLAQTTLPLNFDPMLLVQLFN